MESTQERAIGRIEGKLDRLIADRDDSVKMQTELRSAVEQIKHKQEQAEAQTARLLQRLQKVEKPLQELSRWRERFAGAVMLLCCAGIVTGGAAAVLWQKVAEAAKIWV